MEQINDLNVDYCGIKSIKKFTSIKMGVTPNIISH